MLLELLQAEIQGRRVSVARLCTVSSVSTSNAMRWLKALEHRELAVRSSGSNNADEEFVELSQKGSSVLRRYFKEIVEPIWPLADDCRQAFTAKS
jgi:predicted transcriptional regulator